MSASTRRIRDPKDRLATHGDLEGVMAAVAECFTEAEGVLTREASKSRDALRDELKRMIADAISEAKPRCARCNTPARILCPDCE